MVKNGTRVLTFLWYFVRWIRENVKYDSENNKS